MPDRFFYRVILKLILHTNRALYITDCLNIFIDNFVLFQLFLYWTPICLENGNQNLKCFFSDRPLVLTGYKDACTWLIFTILYGEGGGWGGSATRPFIVIDYEYWKMDKTRWTERVSSLSSRSVHLCKICLGFEYWI